MGSPCQGILDSTKYHCEDHSILLSTLLDSSSIAFIIHILVCSKGRCRARHLQGPLPTKALHGIHQRMADPPCIYRSLPWCSIDSMGIGLIRILSSIHFIIMVTSSSAGTVQLSPQVSECLSLDLGFLPFICQSVGRHRSGDFGQLVGPELETSQAAFCFGGRYSSSYGYSEQGSQLFGQQLVIVSPSARDTTFVSFRGELF